MLLLELIKEYKGRIICAVVGIILTIAGFFVYFDAQKKLAQAFDDSYSSTKSQVSRDVYNEFKDKGYDYAEEKYHTSNRVTINIGNLKETNALEVLSASDTYLNVVKEEDSEDSQRWVAIPGTAVYTVDLSMSEIVRDDFNRYILVRLKSPELTNIRIDYDNVKIYLYDYKSGFGKVNGTYEGGADEAQRDYAEAYSQMYERFYSDQKFYISAKNSAKDIITSMVKNLNPEIRDLTVEVEFF